MIGPAALVEMLQEVAQRPGMSLRLYHVAGSPSGPHWQAAITWDGDAGQIAQGGFKVACRSDPIDAIADTVRQALMYPTAARPPPAAAADDDDDILGGPAPADDDEDILG